MKDEDPCWFRIILWFALAFAVTAFAIAVYGIGLDAGVF